MNSALAIKMKNAHIPLLIKWSIIAALIYYLIANLNPSSLYKTFLNADSFLIFIALLLLPVNIYLQYLKWKNSVYYFCGPEEERNLIYSLFAGFSAGIFTPARIGEYFGRGIGLRGKPVKDIATAVFFDKIYTMLVIFIFGAAGSILYIKFHYVLTLSLIIFGLYLVIKKYIPQLFFAFQRLRIVNKISERIGKVKTPDRYFIKQQLFISFLYYIIFWMQFVFLIAAFSGGEILFTYFFVAACTMFVKTFVPNFISGEFGVRESAAVFFLTLAGGKPEAGFNAAVMIFLINIVIPSIIGLIPLLRKQYA